MDIHSGGELSKNQMAIDINHYDIRLKVDTKRKMISGYVDIKMKIVDNLRFIELDLITQYFVSKVLIDSVSTPFKHKKNKIYVAAQDLKIGDLVNIRVTYKGKPPVAKKPPWSGGFTWEKSEDGYPSVSYTHLTLPTKA